MNNTSIEESLRRKLKEYFCSDTHRKEEFSGMKIRNKSDLDSAMRIMEGKLLNANLKELVDLYESIGRPSLEYLPVKSFNRKQWFAYDENADHYVDPPISVLEDIRLYSEDESEQEKYFATIIALEPDWLNDSDYWYDEIE